MSIEVWCERCHESLNEPGGVLLTPPTSNGYVMKFHLCASCHKTIEKWIKEYRNR